MTEEQIAEFFVSCGGVQEVRLLRERGTSKPRVYLFSVRIATSKCCVFFVIKLHVAKIEFLFICKFQEATYVAFFMVFPTIIRNYLAVVAATCTEEEVGGIMWQDQWGVAQLIYLCITSSLCEPGTRIC